MSDDEHFMSIALKLAQTNLGNVAPNPAVGCVLVKDGTIIGEGCTARGGRPHAEVVAIQNASTPARDATAYVTLEPCCHYGVTGPCALEVIKAGVKKVVIATIDPDRRVAGGGVKALKEAGVEVEVGVMREQAEKLNVGFFYSKTLNRPFIACKVAVTLDGKIAAFTGHSQWITGEQTRRWVHRLRAEYDAIMIGSNTLVKDDPLLTCRLPGLEDRSPIRLIIDSKGNRLKEEHNIARTADRVKSWVITIGEAKEQIRNVNYLAVNSSKETADKVCLEEMAAKLVSEIGVTRVLVEGGGVLNTELLKRNLIDRLIICRSGKILGNDAIPFVGNLGIQSLDDCYRFKKTENMDFGEDVVEVWDRLK